MKNPLDNLFLAINAASNDDITADEIEHISKSYFDFMVMDILSVSGSKGEAIKSLNRKVVLIERLLVSINTGVVKAMKSVETVYSGINTAQKFREKYEYYVNANDGEKCFDFYRKLNKQDYTQIEVVQLLKVAGISLSRQTIAKYKAEGKFGNKASGKAQRISKEGLYKFFRKEIQKREQ
jgi:hypothetical protein